MEFFSIESLQPELQLKILQYLNFNALFSIKQANRFFCAFINKYEHVLARRRINTLFFINHEVYSSSFRFLEFMYCIKTNVKSIDFPLNNELLEKWIPAINKQIPLYIIIKKRDTYNEKLSFILSNDKGMFVLLLPIYPKSIEEFKLVRYWIKKVFLCDFEKIFISFVLNPEMIKLLFDCNEIAKLKLNCQKASLPFCDENIDALKFTFDILVVNNCLTLSFQDFNTKVKDTNLLLELLTKYCARINKVFLFDAQHIQIPFYNTLINHLETAIDSTKTVKNISFDYCRWNISEINVRRVKTTENNELKKNYKINNIYDPRMIFSISWTFDKSNDDLIDCIDITHVI